MSIWTLTDDERNAGTGSLRLYFELNDDEKLRFPFPPRSFVRGGLRSLRTSNPDPARVDPEGEADGFERNGCLEALEDHLSVPHRPADVGENRVSRRTLDVDG